MLRLKVAVAVAIIKACPTSLTPEAFASQLCSKRCLEIADSVRRENQLKEEGIHLRQKLLDNGLKMDEILLLKRHGMKFIGLVILLPRIQLRVVPCARASAETFVGRAEKFFNSVFELDVMTKEAAEGFGLPQLVGLV